MNELALFAGAGGGILGAHLLGWRTVCAVETEPYCREVLLRRQQDGLLPLFPIWDDCNTFEGGAWSGIVDVITAGFPCQPFSVAGKQEGADDSRNGWPATIRIVDEVRPSFVLLENVPGLLTAGHGYFGQVLGDLATIGYDAVWDCFPAAAIGAPHRRDRLWVLAYPNSDQHQGSTPAVGGPAAAHLHTDTNGRRCEEQRQSKSRGEQSQPRSIADGLGEDRRLDGTSAGNVPDAPDHPMAERGQHALDARPGSRGESEQGRGPADDRQRPLRSAGKPAGDGVPDTERERLERLGERGPASRSTDRPGEGGHTGWWQTEPDVGRVVDGMAHRVDQLRALGNGQVASVVPFAWHSLRKKAGFR